MAAQASSQSEEIEIPEAGWSDEIFLPSETFEEDKKKLEEVFKLQDRHTSFRYSSAAFAYASCLATSSEDDDLKLGAKLFRDLADDGYKQRDCYYRAAVCFFQLGKFADSRKAIERAQDVDPKFVKAQEFASHLARNARKEGRLGFILATGLTAAFLLLVGFRRGQLRNQAIAAIASSETSSS